VKLSGRQREGAIDDSWKIDDACASLLNHLLSSGARCLWTLAILCASGLGRPVSAPPQRCESTTAQGLAHI